MKFIFFWGIYERWDFIFWLLPTIVLVPFIVRWNKYYKKKFKID